MADEPMDMDEGAAALEALVGDTPAPRVVQGDDLPDDADEALDEGAEPDDTGEEDEPEGEAETPPIEPPASLNADEKAAFAQLPPEAQRMLQAVEARRNGQVQEATTRAAAAQRQAQADAARQTEEAKAQFADQLLAFASAYAPQRPNPANYGDNMQAYARDTAQYDHDLAQHQALMQQVQGIGAEAQQGLERHQQEWGKQEAQRLRSELPDWFDAEKGPALQSELTALGQELGFDQDAMSQAGATDILALRKAQGWKSDAEKWRALQARKMAGVRASKTTKPNAAQPQAAVRQQRVSQATDRLRSTGSLDDAAVAISGLLNSRGR